MHHIIRHPNDSVCCSRRHVVVVVITGIPVTLIHPALSYITVGGRLTLIHR